MANYSDTSLQYFIFYLTDNEDCFPIYESYRSDEPMVEDIFVTGGGTTFLLAVPVNGGKIYEFSNYLEDVGKRRLERGSQENAASDLLHS